ncbi:MAG: hypothetical protein FGF47_00655 [Candidatus Brockarchaeota archaeon]|nr:hypothetical protein [Candidatus Brockarchaeota archaeon]
MKNEEKHEENTEKEQLNELGKFFAERSTMSKKQIEAILKTREKERLRKGDYILGNRRISKGAFYRIVKQARENIEEAIYTILFMIYQNIITEEDVATLVAFVNLLRTNKIDEEKEEQIKEGVEEAIKKIIKQITKNRKHEIS